MRRGTTFPIKRNTTTTVKTKVPGNNNRRSYDFAHHQCKKTHAVLSSPVMSDQVQTRDVDLTEMFGESARR